MTPYLDAPAHNSPPIGGEDLVLAVQLTPAHIAQGHPGECANCPLALAIRDACRASRIALVEHPANVKVFGDHANIYLEDGRWYVAAMPSSVRDFVRRFDHGTVDPATSMTVTLHFEIADAHFMEN